MSLTDLNTVATYATVVSSSALRLLSVIFLRWIPGHPFPPFISTLLAIYVSAFAYHLWHTSPYRVIEKELEIITKDALPESDAKDVDPKYANGKPDEELDVQETVVLAEKDPEAIKTLVTGLPSPTSLLWSTITFGINILLLAMVCDLTYRPTIFYPSHDLSMARVGYVSDTTAKVLIREPDPSKYPIFASYRLAEYLVSVGDVESSWKSAGTISWLDNTTDFTGTFTLRSLKPDSRYQYTANNHTGYFTTAPKIGQISDRPINGGTFTFLQSSCLKNNFPYAPLAHPLANQGLRYLGQTLESLHAQFMLFLGDFIYIDVPRRHGSAAEDHRREYRQVYSSPDWPGASQELPWIHVYDDHEIANDWDKNTTGVFAAANEPYELYHTSVNPPVARKGETYFSFTQGPASFFMLDTRRYRSPNDGSNGSDPITGEPTKSMLGAQQRGDLLAWLRRSEPAGVRWKIVVSSVPFTRNWFFNAQDTWRGYLGERQLILEAMWDVGLRGGVGVVVLSGDRHEFAATSFPPPPEGKEEYIGLGPAGVGANPLGIKNDVAITQPLTRRKRWPTSATVHEFSASPLNMFYLPYRTYSESSTSEEYVSDVCVKYVPDGNSKFGAISISNPPKSDQSILHYRLFVDGLEAWSHTITTPPNMGGSSRATDAIWG